MRCGRHPLHEKSFVEFAAILFILLIPPNHHLCIRFCQWKRQVLSSNFGIHLRCSLVYTIYIYKMRCQAARSLYRIQVTRGPLFARLFYASHETFAHHEQMKRTIYFWHHIWNVGRWPWLHTRFMEVIGLVASISIKRKWRAIRSGRHAASQLNMSKIKMQRNRSADTLIWKSKLKPSNNMRSCSMASFRLLLFT